MSNIYNKKNIMLYENESTRITYIYCLKDSIDNKIKYIGKSDNPNDRLKNHIKKHKYTKSFKNNWIKKLIEKNFKPILEIIEVVPFSEWSFWEKYWISQFKYWGFILYNLTDGGDGGNFGYLVNKKISDKLKNRKFSHETLKKMSVSAKKRKISEEGRKSLSIHRTGQKNPMYGKKQSRYCIESKQKPITQLSENNEIIKDWLSIKQESQYLSINRNSIRMVCNNQRKTAGGYKWVFK
jgi:group I intron endonuclease